MLWVLDSTVLIDYLRGRPVIDRFSTLKKGGDTAATTAVNVEEVVRGLRPVEEAPARRLFNGLVVLPVNGLAGWQAGEWRRSYAARGITLSQADCLVASTAFAHGASLATGNPKHFPMPDLTVEHWPVGT